MNKKTLVVNLYGGPGSGKSTMMANVFSELKWRNINCEMVTEFAKKLTWSNREHTLNDQLYLLGKQNHDLFTLNDQVDVIITDSPILLNIIYNRVHHFVEDHDFNVALDRMTYTTFNLYNNMNVFLNRVKPYNPKGRLQSEDESKEIDEMLKILLHEFDVEYDIFDGKKENAAVIADIIEEKIKSL